MADWYDHPQYFDMVFRDETPIEIDFFQSAFAKYATRPVQRLLEPGCGSGRLVAELASEGFDVTGLDLSKPMLRYLERRLSRRGLKANLVQGDMTSMSFPEQFDSAFCTFNTFRHLLSEKEALQHLQSVAAHLRPGGIYILGFHIIPLDAETECIERWRASHGGTQVSVTLRVIDFNRRRRREMLRVSIKAVKRSGKTERIRSEFPLRLYTHTQAISLLQEVADLFEIVGVHDFDYDLETMRKIDDDLTDAVFVLRRKP